MGSDVPYGMWICKDGSVYLFNKKYEPIAVREPGRPAQRIQDMSTYVEFCSQVRFWTSPYEANLEDMKKILDDFMKDTKSRYAS